MKPSIRAKLFNAIAEAWNRGTAPWAYVRGSSEAVRVWNAAHVSSVLQGYREPGSKLDHDHAADVAVSRWAVANGLDLPRSLRG